MKILIFKELNKSESLIKYVLNLKGQNLRYAVDPTKIHNELDRILETKFANSIRATIKWYIENRSFQEDIINGEYRNYYKKMYGNELSKYKFRTGEKSMHLSLFINSLLKVHIYILEIRSSNKYNIM